MQARTVATPCKCRAAERTRKAHKGGKGKTMYNHFEFKDGGNPYITTNNAALWRMIRKYYVIQTGSHTFTVEGERQFWTSDPFHKLTAREKAQVTLQDFAHYWQMDFSDMKYAWGDICDWNDFFTEYGRKYGLLREFKENGIC